MDIAHIVQMALGEAQDHCFEQSLLDRSRYFPYRYGQALWAYIGGKYGDRAVGTLLRASIGRGGVESAFEQILGVDEKTLTKEWHEAVIANYRPIAEATMMPAAFARPTAWHSGSVAHDSVT